MDSDPVRQALTRSLVTFARDIGAALIAEGIETRPERDTLLQLGVQLGQGYLFARPGPLPAPTETTASAPAVHSSAAGDSVTPPRPRPVRARHHAVPR